MKKKEWRKSLTEIEDMQLQKIKKENKIKNFIEYILSSRWYVLFIAIIILLKTIFFYRNTVFRNDTIWLWSIRQTCFFIVIIVFPLLLFKKSIRRFEAGIILDFLISFLLFIDELYYTYAQNIISIMQAGNIQYKDEIISAIPSLLDINQLLYFIDFIILGILLIGKFIQIRQQENFKFIPAIITLRMYYIFLYIISSNSRIFGISNRLYIQ